jgi:ribosomal protein S6
MNTKPYELVLMVDPTFSEQARKECIDTCLALLVGHSIVATDDMGMIKTVYPFG